MTECEIIAANYLRSLRLGHTLVAFEMALAMEELLEKQHEKAKEKCKVKSRRKKGKPSTGSTGGS